MTLLNLGLVVQSSGGAKGEDTVAKDTETTGKTQTSTLWHQLEAMPQHVHRQGGVVSPGLRRVRQPHTQQRFQWLVPSLLQWQKTYTNQVVSHGSLPKLYNERYQVLTCVPDPLGSTSTLSMVLGRHVYWSTHRLWAQNQSPFLERQDIYSILIEALRKCYHLPAPSAPSVDPSPMPGYKFLRSHSWNQRYVAILR